MLPAGGWLTGTLHVESHRPRAGTGPLIEHEQVRLGLSDSLGDSRPADAGSSMDSCGQN